MWGDMGWGWGGGWGLLGGLHMILWWVLLILGIVVLFKWLMGSASRGERETGNHDNIAVYLLCTNA